MKLFMYWLYCIIIHKYYVFTNISKFAIKLIHRAIVHDISKLNLDEYVKTREVVPKIKHTTYGSAEYYKLLQELDITKHYKLNRHHPEHFTNGIRGMNLLDIVEMFCDWQAAVRKHKDGSMLKSIKHKAEQLDLSEDVISIFKNSIYNKRG